MLRPPLQGRAALPSLASRPIRIDGRFDDWRDVQPEFRDTTGDQVRRDHRGWNTNVTYRNFMGRNDIIAAKVGWDKETASFYVRTREPITPPDGTNWMLLPRHVLRCEDRLAGLRFCDQPRRRGSARAQCRQQIHMVNGRQVKWHSQGGTERPVQLSNAARAT